MRTIWIISEKRKFLTAMLFVYLSSMLSCSKKDSSPNDFSNNVVKATIVYTNGSTIEMTSKAEKASIGCSIEYSFVRGTSEANAIVGLTASDTSSGTLYTSCIRRSGAYYNFTCQYTPDVTAQIMREYNSRGAITDSVKFTAVTDHYMEGEFNAMCIADFYNSQVVLVSDTIIVSGTFKGYY
jgi:hypothetical protein